MKQRLIQIGWVAAPILVAILLVTILLLLIQNTNTGITAGPAEVADALWKSLTRQGEISPRKLASVLDSWIPLTLVSVGLVITFRAGLWNIGVEGQMVLGGLFAAGVAFSVPIDNPVLIIPLEILAAMLGGALYALVVGILKTRLGVHEIFSGVALNALANQITLQMIAVPWRPAEADKAQYSRPLPDYALFPGISPDFDVSLALLLLTCAAIVIAALLLGRTRWGLNLKATGKNARSALLMGVPVGFTALSALAVCGALAGIGGAHRVLFFYDTGIRSQFSGGIGFLGLLVVLLVNMRLSWVPFVTLAFAVILNATTQLQIAGLDTSLAGVLQGTIVLTVLLFNGLRDRAQSANEAPAEGKT